MPKKDRFETPAAVTLKIKSPKHGLRVAFLPDVQAKPKVSTRFLTWAGQYLADQRPDLILQVGDFADMESLSTYEDGGSLSAQSKRYIADIDASKRAMDALLTPIAKVRGYNPRKVLTLGNHEHRIVRAVESNPRHLEGVFSLADLEYEKFGFEVFDFLRPVVVNGVAFSHYFCSGQMGRPIGTARALLSKLHQSAVCGHLQGRDIAYAKRADGSSLTGLICGSFYEHSESYLNAQTNSHFRGLYILNELRDGSFDEMPISIDFLRRKFATKK